MVHRAIGLFALVMLATALAPTAQADDAEQVSDGDKLGNTAEAIVRMRELLSEVLGHLEEARDERDVVKLNCVNEKLTAIKGLLAISEQADVTLQEALARRDNEAASHEYEKITIASRKVEQLYAESEACIGELAVYSGDTAVEVVVENVPKTDPTQDTGEVDVITRPPAASPFQ